MPRLLVSSEFKKGYKKLRHSPMERAADEALALLADDPNHPALKLHPLRGKMAGMYSC